MSAQVLASAKKNALGGRARWGFGLAVATAACVALGLVGCGDGNPAGNGEESGGPSPVTLANLEGHMIEVEGIAANGFKRGCRADKGEGFKLINDATCTGDGDPVAACKGEDVREVADTTCLAVKDTIVPSFYICKFEVTQGLWKEVMGDTANHSVYKGDDLPVTNVAAVQIDSFFIKLNEKTANGIYKYRLPWENEWEFAARGGKEYKDNDYVYSGANDDAVDAVAWYGKADGPSPVGKLRPNGLGIYDMSGNVWEVVMTASRSASLVDRPGRGAERGGSWFGKKDYCRATYRINVGSFTLASEVRDNPVSDRGFRIAAVRK